MINNFVKTKLIHIPVESKENFLTPTNRKRQRSPENGPRKKNKTTPFSPIEVVTCQLTNRSYVNYQNQYLIAGLQQSGKPLSSQLVSTNQAPTSQLNSQNQYHYPGPSNLHKLYSSPSITTSQTNVRKNEPP
ncbi:hypothetical protein BpHYR1_049567 [Brachionus plicatilis]|uniref:Uncharacterized protein n=1 Tax=Brachionus plicatilis TaxID=10195 RepID=A0A3M7PKK1_BRAPC|nr:hypothetical protein BpHYR1_049567 [Brachionus plicatilis]